MCFSSPSTSPDCMVFGIADYASYSVDISIISRGEVSWTTNRFDYDATNVRFFSSYGNAVFFKGSFYCLSIDGKLGVFDPKKRGSRRWRIIDKLQHPYKSIQGKFPIQENFLLESNGDLISVCMGPIEEYVRIFKLNYEYEIKWEEVNSFGDKMIFASLTGSISLTGGIHGMENTIYFPSFDKGGNGLFYSLASRKFHSLGFPLARKDLYNVKRPLHCALITPAISEFYLEEELRWLPNPINFLPSSGRVKVKEVPPAANPSFVLTHAKDRKNQLFFNMFEGCHNLEGIPEVRQKRIATCAYGWLVLVDWDSSDCLLLNPQTMEKIQLPQVPELFNICAISSSPNNPNCIVLLIHYRSKDAGDKFIYCRPGENEWTVVTNKKPEELEESTELVYYKFSNVIGYQGKIYGLVDRIKLVEIDFDPVFEVKPVKRVKPDVRDLRLPFTSFLGTIDDDTYMVESCGELFLIRIFFRGVGAIRLISDVELLKLDYTTKIWELVGSLGDNIAFFCCGTCCISCSIEGSKIKGNCIYFTDSYLDDRNVYAFDYESGCITISSSPFSDVHDFKLTDLIFS